MIFTYHLSTFTRLTFLFFLFYFLSCNTITTSQYFFKFFQHFPCASLTLKFLIIKTCRNVINQVATPFFCHVIFKSLYHVVGEKFSCNNCFFLNFNLIWFVIFYWINSILNTPINKRPILNTIKLFYVFRIWIFSFITHRFEIFKLHTKIIWSRDSG